MIELKCLYNLTLYNNIIKSLRRQSYIYHLFKVTVNTILVRKSYYNVRDFYRIKLYGNNINWISCRTAYIILFISNIKKIYAKKIDCWVCCQFNSAEIPSETLVACSFKSAHNILSFSVQKSTKTLFFFTTQKFK